MNRSYKDPEKFLMCLGDYAYDPYLYGGDIYIQVAHRLHKGYRFVAKVVQSSSGVCIVPVESSMPQTCVNEFAAVLQRNIGLLIGWCCTDA